MSKETRRDFIKKSAGAAGVGIVLPVLNRNAMGTTILKQVAENQVGNGNVLVIVELGGGNDGLNTIVPLRQYATYKSLRDKIAHPQAQILPLYGANTVQGAPTMGMTPNFAALKPVFDAGKIAVIQSAHYPNPNLSHESSRRNYYTGIPSANIALSGSGWIGRHSALFGNTDNPLDTISIGGVNKTLYAAGAKVAGVNAGTNGTASGYTFSTTTNGTNNGERNNQLNAAKVIDASESAKPYLDLWEETTVDAIISADQVTAASATPNSPGVSYPTDSFANGLRLMAKLIASSNPVIGSRVFYISIGGFDSHSNQIIDQANLHARVANGLKAFYDDLSLLGLGNKVVVLVWSEFGRRVAENLSGPNGDLAGTDHGTANNMLVLGGAVKGGVYGPDPDLTNLTGGNLRWSVDFRSVYTELISKWLGGDPVVVLNGTFPQLGFL